MKSENRDFWSVVLCDVDVKTDPKLVAHRSYDNGGVHVNYEGRDVGGGGDWVGIRSESTTTSIKKGERLNSIDFISEATETSAREACTTESESDEEEQMVQAAQQLVALHENARAELQSPPLKRSGLGSRYKCDICKALFRRKSYLRKHVNAVHKKLKPYKCLICDKAFGYKGARAKHHRTIHLGQKPYACPEPTCDMRFSEKGNMKKHYRNRHYAT